MRLRKYSIELMILMIAATVVISGAAYVYLVQDYDAGWQSDDYLGDGLYGCPNCDWEGYPGVMTFQPGSGGFFSPPGDHYCPECGCEIDVRG